jgi:hypothetical protein
MKYERRLRLGIFAAALNNREFEQAPRLEN